MRRADDPCNDIEARKIIVGGSEVHSVQVVLGADFLMSDRLIAEIDNVLCVEQVLGGCGASIRNGVSDQSAGFRSVAVDTRYDRKVVGR